MIVSVIPARKGSVTIPRKNFQKFAGKPLFEWTIESSLESRYVSTTIVSTDDQGALDLAESKGALALLRPEKLAGGDLHAVHVVLHVIEVRNLQANDIVLMLLPTCPLRTSKHIDESMKLLNDVTMAPSIIGVYESGLPQNYRRIVDNQLVPIVEGEMNVQRQDITSLYRVNGAIFGARVGDLQKHGTFHMQGAIPYKMLAYDSIDINSWPEFHRAEEIFLERQSLNL